MQTNMKTWHELANEKQSISPFPPDETLNKRIILFRGDITTLPVDCIVNAANSRLRGGGGVDGAIHDAAGKELYKYLCDHYQHCDTGDFRPTPGFKLPSKEILHAVGPIGENPAMLKSCYSKCLHYMKTTNKQTIAFCCISTGIYGYDNEKACPVALETVRFFLEIGRAHV